MAYCLQMVQDMETRAIDIERSLVQRLEKKGIAIPTIPRFIKDLTNFFADDHFMSLTQVNRHLHLLGWNGVQIDYHTFQLAKAYFENDSTMS